MIKVSKTDKMLVTRIKLHIYVTFCWNEFLFISRNKVILRPIDTWTSTFLIRQEQRNSIVFVNYIRNSMRNTRMVKWKVWLVIYMAYVDRTILDLESEFCMSDSRAQKNSSCSPGSTWGRKRENKKHLAALDSIWHMTMIQINWMNIIFEDMRPWWQPDIMST